MQLEVDDVRSRHGLQTRQHLGHSTNQILPSWFVLREPVNHLVDLLEQRRGVLRAGCAGGLDCWHLLALRWQQRKEAAKPNTIGSLDGSAIGGSEQTVAQSCDR